MDFESLYTSFSINPLKGKCFLANVLEVISLKPIFPFYHILSLKCLKYHIALNLNWQNTKRVKPNGQTGMK